MERKIKGEIENAVYSVHPTFKIKVGENLRRLRRRNGSPSSTQAAPCTRLSRLFCLHKTIEIGLLLSTTAIFRGDLADTIRPSLKTVVFRPYPTATRKGEIGKKKKEGKFRSRECDQIQALRDRRSNTWTAGRGKRIKRDIH